MSDYGDIWMSTIDTQMKELDSVVFWVERLLSHNRPDLREDLFQVGRLAALMSLSTYDENRGSSRRTWATKYVRRDMVRALQKESMTYIDIDALLYEDGIEELADEELQLLMEREAEVERLLSQLSDWEAKVVVEHLYKDKSFEEIGKKYSYSKQYVGQTWKKSVVFLRQLFS